MRSIHLFLASLFILCSLALFQNCSGNKSGSDATSTEDQLELSSSSGAEVLLRRDFCGIVPLCAAPPEGCHYENRVKPIGQLCASGCGELVCDQPPIDEPPSCPDVIRCPIYTPPSPDSKLSCKFAPAPVDSSGCQSGCGEYICEPIPEDPPVCPMIMCPVLSPPAYDPNTKCRFVEAPIGSDGCQIGCGSFVCEPIEPPGPAPTPVPGPAPICPAILCAAPPEGCSYGPAEIGRDGCQISCGQLSCSPVPINPPRVKPPISCPMISCVAPEPGCRYVADQTAIGEDGCNISCGNIVCEDK